MPIKAVLFDLWETLIQDHPDRAQPRRVWRTEAVHAVFSKHDFVVEQEVIGSALDASNIALMRLHDEGRDVDAPGRETLLLDILEEKSGKRPPDSVNGELLDIIASMPVDKAPHLAPGAAETLRALRALGLPTALVSNAGMTTAPNLRLLLRHYEIDVLFDSLIFSDELQLAKPDPRIFQAAADGVKVAMGDCAFVGDNPLNDIAGALGAGMYAVQIGTKMREGVTAVPHVRIDTLSELIPALQAKLQLV
jgi:putative hydrolase of the HAD superfamily